MSIKERLIRIIEDLPEEEAAEELERLSGRSHPNGETAGDFERTATTEEWERFVDEFAEDFGPDVPILSDEQLRREHLYEDRGL